MFYSSQLLSRKTALGICWLASHLESKRLKRAQVFEVSISASCDSIINPEAPLALRLSGQLLLGVVRIYQRKLTFLETDAKNAIDGLQRKEGGVALNLDLPDGGTVPEGAITLPDADDLGMPAALFSINDPIDALTPALHLGSDQLMINGTQSLTFAEDISDVFGSSRWTPTDDRLDLDRRFSAELERLRSVAAAERARESSGAGGSGKGDALFVGDDSFGALGLPIPPEDEIMEAPAPDLFAMTVPSAGMALTPVPDAFPTDPTQMPGISDARFSPGSMLGGDFDTFGPGLSDAMPEVGEGEGGGADSIGGPEVASPTPKKRSRKLEAARLRRKRAHFDTDSRGRPVIELSADEIRRLLDDRAPLLKRRGLKKLQKTSISVSQLFDVDQTISFFLRPACFDRLHPDLMAEFDRSGKHVFNTLKRRRGEEDYGDALGSEEPNEDDLREKEQERERDVSLLSGGGDFMFGDYGDGPSPAPSWGGGGIGDGAMGMEDNDDAIENSPADVGLGLGLGAPLEGNRNRDHHGGSPSPLPIIEIPRSEQEGYGGLLLEVEDEQQGVGTHNAHSGFTARTKLALDHFQRKLQPGVESFSLDSVVEGKSRLEACRWFFESLVLRSKGFVDLEQKEPFGEISVRPLTGLNHGNAQINASQDKTQSWVAA